MRFSTKAVRAGQEPDQTTGAVVVPIHLATTFQQNVTSDGRIRPKNGYEYGRTDNPTRKALETSLATLEVGVAGICFSSGSAATHALIEVLLDRGDHVLLGEDAYGGTRRLFKFSSQKIGDTFDTIDTLGLSRSACRASSKPRRASWSRRLPKAILSMVMDSPIGSKLNDSPGSALRCPLPETYAAQ